jgi:CheY-like chemotaxis protein
VFIHRQYPGQINVLVTDISLPGRNGYILAKTLLDADPGLNVIFMSGLAGGKYAGTTAWRQPTRTSSRSRSAPPIFSSEFGRCWNPGALS